MKYILSISEFAKLNHISTDTLRYYDRIGLMKPAGTMENGYRYYSIRQYEKIRTIIELRAAGMPIEEIREYFEDRNLEKSVEMIRSYQRKVEQQAEEISRLNEALKQKISFLEDLSDLPEMETVFEEDFPVRYMLTFERKSGSREEHALEFTKLTDELKGEIPILASDRVGVYAGEDLLKPNKEMIEAVPMLLVRPEEADAAYLTKIEAGHYVCMYYRNGILEKYDPSFEKLKSYLRDRQYQIRGKILQIYKVDVTLTNHSEETVMELQVPTEKQD